MLLKTIFQGDNFGSSLQAYALKNYIQNTFNVDCIVIERKEVGYKAILFSLNNKLVNITKSLLSVRLFVESWTSHLSKGSRSPCFSAKILERFQKFTSEKIAPVYLSLYELKQLANQDDCLLCITGSDQVWNPTGTHINKENFLLFSPKGKNLSYAASIGASQIPYYNELSFRKGVSNIRFLSVREQTGQFLLQRKYGLKAQLCVDPVLLVGRYFWENYIKGSVHTEPYVFAFFLNKPSQEAMEMMKYYEKTGIVVKVLSRDGNNEYYGHSNRIENTDPFSFLTLVKEAYSILTDSFHGMMFSLIFEKDFYIFERNYGKHVSQSSRIESLLNRLSINARYIRKGNMGSSFDKLDYSRITPLLENDRIKSVQFLADAFQIVNEEQGGHKNVLRVE